MKLPQRAQVPADGLSGCSAQRAISRSVPSIEAAILPERERSGLRRGERSGLRPRLPLRRPRSTEGCRGETPAHPTQPKARSGGVRSSPLARLAVHCTTESTEVFEVRAEKVIRRVRLTRAYWGPPTPPS